MLFFLSLLAEVQGFGKTPHRYWIFLLLLFFCLQMARIWIITSLGPYWNTKIIVLKGAEAIKKGPYRWIRHPNYWLVTLELILIPLLFQAYITLFLFFLLNQSMLRIRIRTEEKALLAYTNYIKTCWSASFGQSENEMYVKNDIENDSRLCYSLITNENDYHVHEKRGAKP